jgi:hypothetical protein
VLWHGSDGPKRGLADQAATATPTAAIVSQRPTGNGLGGVAGEVPATVAGVDAAGGAGLAALGTDTGGCAIERLAGLAAGPDTGGAWASGDAP